MADTVLDNPARSRFELEVEGHIAFSEYRLAGDTLTFIHTEVPDALAGKGVGSRLIKGALDQIRQRGLKVKSHCSFVSGWLGKHPEYQDLLA
jgi:predicted GNAT family acetyltransferase